MRLTDRDIERSRAFSDAVGVVDGLGVTHCGVKNMGAGAVLELRDPDGTALELYAS